VNFFKQYIETKRAADNYCEIVLGGADPKKLAWLTMVYGCSECGWEHTVYCLIGVEGPPPLRESNRFIPSPFMCGHCPACRKPLSHIRWGDDKQIDPPGKNVPADTAYFSVPGRSQAKKYSKQNYGGAHYIDPTGRTRTP
jgi:hypothetical protein